MNKALGWALRFILGIGILAILLYKIGVTSILETVGQMNLYYLPIIILLYFANLFFGSLNITILMSHMKTKPKLHEIYSYYMLSWAVGLFIPGRVGEVSLVYRLKKKKVPLGEGFLIFVLDKFISVFFLAIISTIGFFMFFDLGTALWLLSLVVSILVVGGLLLFSAFGRKGIKKYVLRKYSKKFKGFSNLLKFFFRKRLHMIFLNFLNTGLRWSVSAVIYFFAFMSFGKYIPFWLILLITCITSVMSFVPITISGLGIRESVGVYLYSQQQTTQIIGSSLEPSLIASAYLLVVICSYAIAAIIFYFSNYKGIFKK
jgi:uncharacterized protein (TIRG00374 family)